MSLAPKMQSILASLQVPIRKIANDEGYINFNTEIKQFDSKCANFLSEVYEITIKGNTDKDEKESNLFIKKKIILTNMSSLPVNDFFCNEEFFYNDLSKVFTYLQDQTNVPPLDRCRIVKAYNGTNKDIIVLENLTKKNFTTYNKADNLPLEYTELAIKELAKFHGLGFVIENKMPEYFNKKIKSLDNLVCFDEDWKKYIQNVCTCIANIYYDNNEVKKKIENFLPVIISKYPEYNSNKLNVKCTLTHGDYRMNNVLVREEEGKPVEVVPIDYQIIHYGCPIKDFFYFVFTGTSQEFRRHHLNDLKELYFDSLSKYLKYFEMDVEAVYPRQEFEKVYTEWLDYGLMIAFVAAGFIFVPETKEDMQDASLSEMSLNLDERAKCMVRGWVDDYINWGIL